MEVCFNFNFHPVGQGLFTSGSLYTANSPQPKFLWVFDCGSVSIKNLNTWNVKTTELQVMVHAKREIELLALSHFDTDHINGVTSLLAKFNVDVLLLPYVHLWRRLLIAFRLGLAFGSEEMSYLIDPAAFLRGRGQIDRVIFVLPSDGEVPPPPAAGGPNPMDGQWRLSVETKTLRQGNPMLDEFGTSASEVEVLPPGQAISVQGLWEFCPYNRPLEEEIPDGFVDLVSELRDILLSAGPKARSTALRELKDQYDHYFGSRGKERNIISLSLYGGPVYETWQTCKLVFPRGDSLWSFPRRNPCYYRRHADAPGISDSCGVYYSGDSYLEDNDAFLHLRDYLGGKRMEKIGVFQVNHHGSRHNWHQGLADKVDPFVSIFCSNPKAGPNHHPDADVLRDFWCHRPVQVNKTGFSAGGWLLE